MAVIKFIVDYRGVLTGERYFQVGDVIDLANATALVAEGRAVYVEKVPLKVPPNIPLKAPPDPVLAVDLEGVSLKELRIMAKEADVKGYSRMKRDTLIRHLQDD